MYKRIVFCIIIILLSFLFTSTSPVLAQQYRSETTANTTVGNPPISGGGGGSPTMNDCGGTYNLDPNKRPFDRSKFFPRYAPSNFGDTNCEFTAANFAKAKSNLYNFIHQIDPGYEYNWFSVIIPGESGYDPNAWAPPTGSQAGLNNSGAWGLIQMGSAAVNNGKYDRGDVAWQNQMQNGVALNNTILNMSSGHCPANGRTCSVTTWCYWATARAFACQKK